MTTRRRWTMAGAVWLALSAAAWAQDAPTFPAGGIPDALKGHVGKSVTLLLTSGTQIGGTVGEVRDHTVVLKNVIGRDFSDALVSLDDVAVVEVRARGR
jgi:hypothetical protein